MLTSRPSTPSTLASIRASSPNSSTLLPAIETIVVTLFARSHAKSFSKKDSMPGPCKPMELSMPLGVSAIRGVARPERGSIMMLLVTTAPSVDTSPNCASSLPAAAQPDAVRVGAESCSDPRLVVKSTDISDHLAVARQTHHLAQCVRHPSEHDRRGRPDHPHKSETSV